MDTHRFNGVPINLDLLRQEEFDSLQQNVHQRLRAILGEVATLNIHAGREGLASTSHVIYPDSIIQPNVDKSTPIPLSQT